MSSNNCYDNVSITCQTTFEAMKKAIVSTVMIFGLIAGATAQREAGAERIEAFKVAFFTQKLQLTTEEAQAFWPLYNEYERKREELRKAMKPDTRPELMSDEELRAHLYKQLDTEAQLVALRRAYFEKFMEVLPLRKVAMIPQAEQQFKRRLLEELRRRRAANRSQRDRPNPRSRF